jgi:hypothetical protein
MIPCTANDPEPETACVAPRRYANGTDCRWTRSTWVRIQSSLLEMVWSALHTSCCVPQVVTGAVGNPVGGGGSAGGVYGVPGMGPVHGGAPSERPVIVTPKLLLSIQIVDLYLAVVGAVNCVVPGPADWPPLIIPTHVTHWPVTSFEMWIEQPLVMDPPVVVTASHVYVIFCPAFSARPADGSGKAYVPPTGMVTLVFGMHPPVGAPLHWQSSAHLSALI